MPTCQAVSNNVSDLTALCQRRKKVRPRCNGEALKESTKCVSKHIAQYPYCEDFVEEYLVPPKRRSYVVKGRPIRAKLRSTFPCSKVVIWIARQDTSMGQEAQYTRPFRS